MGDEICPFAMGSVTFRSQWKRGQREWAFAVLETVFCVSAKFELPAPGSEVVVSVAQLLRRRGFSLTVSRYCCKAAGTLRT
jgi:hypothetical protein